MKKFLLTFVAAVFACCFSAMAGTATFDFVSNAYEMTRYSGNDSQYNTDGQTLATVDGVTLTNIKTTGNGTRLWSDGLRFYSGGKIKISSAETLNGIEFTLKSGQSASNFTITNESGDIYLAYTPTSSNNAVVTLTVYYGDTLGGSKGETVGGGTVTPGPEEGDGNSVTFDFKSQTYGAGPAYTNSNTGYVTESSGNVATNGNVQVTFQGTNTSWRFWNDGIRAYRSQTPQTSFTVSVPGGKVTKVSWTVATGATFALSTATGTNITSWTGSQESVSFVYTATGGNYALITLTVEYELGDDAKKAAGLSFPETDYTATIGSTFAAPLLTAATNAVITYTSSNPNVATVGSDGTIELVAIGKTIITASAEENDEYTSGNASYNLMVGPAADTVLTPQQALDAIDNLYTGEAVVEGYIVAIEEVNSSYGNATYTIANTADASASDGLVVYRGKWMNGESFTAEDQIALGGLIKVSGTLVNFNGTKEFTTGSQVLSYTAPAAEPVTVVEINPQNNRTLVVEEPVEDITVYVTFSGNATVKSAGYGNNVVGGSAASQPALGESATDWTFTVPASYIRNLIMDFESGEEGSLGFPLNIDAYYNDGDDEVAIEGLNLYYYIETDIQPGAPFNVSVEETVEGYLDTFTVTPGAGFNTISSTASGNALMEITVTGTNYSGNAKSFANGVVTFTPAITASGSYTINFPFNAFTLSVSEGGSAGEDPDGDQTGGSTGGDQTARSEAKVYSFNVTVNNPTEPTPTGEVLPIDEDFTPETYTDYIFTPATDGELSLTISNGDALMYFWLPALITQAGQEIDPTYTNGDEVAVQGATEFTWELEGGKTYVFNLQASKSPEDLGTYLFTFSGEVAPPAPSVPEAFYFKSEGNGWGTGTEMAIQNGGEANAQGQYVYSAKFDALTNPLSFALSQEADAWVNKYGCGSNGDITVVGELYSAVYDGGNFVNRLVLEDYTVTFYYNPEGDSFVSITGETVAEEDGYQPLQLDHAYTVDGIGSVKLVFTPQEDGVLTAIQTGSNESHLFTQEPNIIDESTGQVSETGMDYGNFEGNVGTYNLKADKTYYIYAATNPFDEITGVTFSWEKKGDVVIEGTPIELGETYTVNSASGVYYYTATEDGVLSAQTGAWFGPVGMMGQYFMFTESTHLESQYAEYSEIVEGDGGWLVKFPMKAGETLFLYNDFDACSFTFSFGEGEETVGKIASIAPTPGKAYDFANYTSSWILNLSPANNTAIESVTLSYETAEGPKTVNVAAPESLGGGYLISVAELREAQSSIKGTDVVFTLNGVKAGGVYVSEYEGEGSEYVVIGENGVVKVTFGIDSPITVISNSLPDPFYQKFPEGSEAKVTLTYDGNIASVGEVKVIQGRWSYGDTGGESTAASVTVPESEVSFAGNTLTINFANVDMTSIPTGSATLAVYAVVGENGLDANYSGVPVFTEYFTMTEAPAEEIDGVVYLDKQKNIPAGYDWYEFTATESGILMISTTLTSKEDLEKIFYDDGITPISILSYIPESTLGGYGATYEVTEGLVYTIYAVSTDYDILLTMVENEPQPVYVPLEFKEYPVENVGDVTVYFEPTTAGTLTIKQKGGWSMPMLYDVMPDLSKDYDEWAGQVDYDTRSNVGSISYTYNYKVAPGTTYYVYAKQFEGQNLTSLEFSWEAEGGDDDDNTIVLNEEASILPFGSRVFVAPETGTLIISTNAPATESSSFYWGTQQYVISTDEIGYDALAPFEFLSETKLGGIGISVSVEAETTYYIKNPTYAEYNFLLTMEEAAPEVPAIPEDAYVVYNDGKVASNLTQEWWWNATWNNEVENPEGEGLVFEFKPTDNGAAGSMGFFGKDKYVAGPLYDATLNFDWFAVGTGKYTVRLTGGGKDYDYIINPEDVPAGTDFNAWSTVSFKIADKFPELSEAWKVETAKDYVFSVIVENASPDAAIYFNRVYYTNVDEDWTAPAVPAPTTVPAIAQNEDDIFSVLTGYGAISYNFGNWGQSTQAETTAIDGVPVISMTNFNYLGLEFSAIDVSDYDYMHVDYWTPNEDTPFGFVPISAPVDKPDYNAPTVVANEWNSYDVPLTYWTEAENVTQLINMAAINQIKFIANQVNNGTTPYGYIANIYFWKKAPEGPVEVTDLTLTFEDFEMDYVVGSDLGDQAQLPLSIQVTPEDAEFVYQGFQFDITLPAGMEVTNAVVDEEFGTAKFAKQASGNVYRVVVAGKKNPAEGSNFNQGYTQLEDVVTLVVNATNADLAAVFAMTDHKAPVVISNIDFSSITGDDIDTTSDFTGYVTVNDVTIYTTEITIDTAELEEPSYTTIEPVDQVTALTEGENLSMAGTITFTQNVTADNIEDIQEVTFEITVNGTAVEDVTEFIDFDEIDPNYGTDGATYEFLVKTDGLLGDLNEAQVVVTAISGAESATYEFTLKAVLLGDSNFNGVVTVSDVVTTANYIAGVKSTRFDFPNADVIGDDDVINTQDITATVSIVMGETYGPRSVRRQARQLATSDVLTVDNFRVNNDAPFTVAVGLDNTYAYAAIQAEVEVPAGMTVKNVTTGARAADHHLIWNRLDNGNVMVVLYSDTNAAFGNVEGALFNLEVVADAECAGISIDRIFAADANSVGYELGYTGGNNESVTTGVDGIDAENGDVRYFTVDGVEIRNPEAGQIVIRVEGDKVEKVLVK